MSRVCESLLGKLKSIPKDFLVVFVFNIISKLFYAATSIFIIRILTVQDYSVFVKFTTISSLVLSIIGSGISLAFVRYATEEKSRGRNTIEKLFFITLILVCFCSIIGFVLIPTISNYYKVNFICAALSVVYGLTLSLDSINRSYFQAKEKFKISGIIDNIKYVILFFGAFGIFFIFHQVTLETIEFTYIIGTLSAFLGGFFVIKLKQRNTNDKIELDKDIVTRLIKESLWLILYCTILGCFNQASVLMLNRYSNDVAVAQYGVALKYYSLLSVFLAAMQTVIRIRTSKKEIVDDAQNRASFSIKWIKNVFPLAAFVSGMAIIFCGFLFPLLNGHEYDASIPAFRILAVGVFISYLFASNVGVMMSAKRYLSICIICFISLIINIFINYMFIPHIGINATALGTVLANGFLNVTCFLVILYDARNEKTKGKNL